MCAFFSRSCSLIRKKESRVKRGGGEGGGRKWNGRRNREGGRWRRGRGEDGGGGRERKIPLKSYL